jgi:hypothetical protein
MENSGTRIVVINKDASSDLLVRIQSRSGMRIWRLEAPGLTATAEVTLAGAGTSLVHLNCTHHHRLCRAEKTKTEFL